MKKFSTVLFLLGYLLVSQSAFAQWHVERDTTMEFVEWKQKRKNSKALNDTLYYEDFGSGGPAANQLPLGWTTQNNAGNSNNWIWSTSPPGGQYSTSVPALSSTTKSNGFLSLPSDLYNTPAPMFVGMAASISSPPISIPQLSSVYLQFQQYFRYCCGTGDSLLVVELSADGQNWTRFDATFSVSQNAASPNALLSEIDVSSILAFQDTAYIRFRQSGPSHYYWMVDDLALIEGPSNAFQVNDLTLHFSDTFSVNPIYTQVPLSMLDSISVSTIVENKGAYSQTGFRLDYSLYQDSTLQGGIGSGVIFQDSVVYTQPFSSFTKDTIHFNQPKIKPSQSGYYRCEVRVSSDSVNQFTQFSSKSQSFTVGDSIIARDRGIFNGSMPFIGFGNSYDSNKVGALINGGPLPKRIKALQFYVANSALAVGAKIRPMLWEIDLSNSNVSLSSSIHLVAQDTAITTITVSMLDSWIQLPFSTYPSLSDLILDPGKQYLIGWEQVNGANGVKFEVGRDRGMEQISPDHSNFIFINDPIPIWGWIPQVPAVRAVIGSQAVGLKSKLEKNGLNVFPNPSNGIVELEWDQEVGNYQELLVMSLSGRLVKRQAIKAGQSQLKLDLENLENGVYVLMLKGSLNRSYSKIILY